MVEYFSMHFWQEGRKIAWNLSILKQLINLVIEEDVFFYLACPEVNCLREQKLAFSRSWAIQVHLKQLLDSIIILSNGNCLALEMFKPFTGSLVLGCLWFPGSWLLSNLDTFKIKEYNKKICCVIDHYLWFWSYNSAQC